MFRTPFMKRKSDAYAQHIRASSQRHRPQFNHDTDDRCGLFVIGFLCLGRPASRLSRRSWTAHSRRKWALTLSNRSIPLPEQDFEKIVLRIGFDGTNPNWRINESSVASLDDVEAHLAAIVGVKNDAPIIIRPDGNVPLGFVIEAYDLINTIGFQKISFAVNPQAN